MQIVHTRGRSNEELTHEMQSLNLQTLSDDLEEIEWWFNKPRKMERLRQLLRRELDRRENRLPPIYSSQYDPRMAGFYLAVRLTADPR